MDKIERELQEMIQQFKAFLIEEDLGSLTVTNYVQDVRAYATWLKEEGIEAPAPGNTPLERVGIESKKYIYHLKNTGSIAPTTANRRIIGLKRFLGYLLEKGHISADIIDVGKLKTKKIQGGNQTEVQWLSRGEVKTVIEAIEIMPRTADNTKARNRALILTLVNCGLRVSELCSLKIADLDFVEGELTVQNGKGSKYRQVPLGNGTARSINMWLEMRAAGGETLGPDDYVFNTKRSPQMTSRGVQHITERLTELSGVEFSPHTLRHTYCKLLADSTGKIEVVAELAGHSNINTTRIYTKPSKKDLKKYVDDIEF